MKIASIPVKVSPLMPLMMLLGMALGLGAELGIAIASLMLHECCHALAAHALRVRVQEIELMPLGGAARMEGIWSLRPAQVILIALSGPAANLALVLIASSLAWAQVLGPYTALLWIRANIALMLFNLLPVLPLDGGRVACALVRSAVGEARALRWFTALGIAAGIALIGLSVWMAISRGLFNVTLAVAGLFLIASANRERSLASGSTVMSLVRRHEELNDETVLPVRQLAALSSARARDIVPHLRPRHIHRIAVYSGGLQLMGILEEKDLVKADESEPLSRLLT